MAKYWQLDYGYKVKVLEGKYKDKTGWVVYGSDRGDICINTHKIPKDMSYQIREPPSNIEILSTDNPHNLKPLQRDLSNFDCAKLNLLIASPKAVLMNRQYFNERMIQSAKHSLVIDIAINEGVK